MNGAPLTKNELRKEPFTETVFVFRTRRAYRLKLLYWDGTGLVMAYKQLEEHSFTWPAIRDGQMTLNHAQFEALFSGLDWRSVRAIEASAPKAVEYCGRMTQARVCAGIHRAADLVSHDIVECRRSS